ncbi:MAG: IS66 family insertion sequence element accessory protein TnpB [Gemmatimonadales bacterium]|nr:MAG: IS66 family insertion sequence element accessory protein TnpB [Gemmatimonadales bacterium]
MLALSPATKVYLAAGKTGLSRSIDGLVHLVAGQMDLDPLSGHLFVFCNRRRTMVKVLYWDRNGFCLWQKRLEKELFRWPKNGEVVVEVGARELMWFLAGLQMEQKGAHKQLAYSCSY